MSVHNDSNYMKRNIKELMPAIAGFALSVTVTAFIFLCLLFLSGGCTRRIYVPQTEIRTEYIHGDTAKFLAIINSLKEQILQKESKNESLIHKEKETVTLNEKGDTILHDHFIYIHLESKERSEYERKIENLRDSISDLKKEHSSVKVDSVPVPYPVERELTKWERVRMDAGGFIICLGAVVALMGAIYLVIKWIVRKKRRM